MTIGGATRRELEALAAEVAERAQSLAAGLVSDGRACLEVHPKRGCSCEFLKTPDSVEGERLDLVADLSQELGDVLELLSRKAPRGLAFSTGRVGDPLRHAESVTMRHLAALLRSNQLGMNTRYLVRTRGTVS